MSGALHGRVCLLTGASGGIGRALADAGAELALTYHARPDEAQAVAAAVRERGGRAVTLVGDLADPAVPATLVRRAVDARGPIDLLVPNAGRAIGPATTKSTWRTGTRP